MKKALLLVVTLWISNEAHAGRRILSFPVVVRAETEGSLRGCSVPISVTCQNISEIPQPVEVVLYSEQVTANVCLSNKDRLGSTNWISKTPSNCWVEKDIAIPESTRTKTKTLDSVKQSGGDPRLEWQPAFQCVFTKSGPVCDGSIEPSAWDLTSQIDGSCPSDPSGLQICVRSGKCIYRGNIEVTVHKDSGAIICAYSVAVRTPYSDGVGQITVPLNGGRPF